MSGSDLSRPGSSSSCDISRSGSYIGCGNDGAIMTVSVPTGVTPGAVGGSTLSPVVIAARDEIRQRDARMHLLAHDVHRLAHRDVRDERRADARGPTRAR